MVPFLILWDAVTGFRGDWMGYEYLVGATILCVLCVGIGIFYQVRRLQTLKADE